MLRLKKALADQVLIEEIQRTKSDGGILIPETAKSQERLARIGKVLAVGPDVSADIEVGATVLFDPLHRRHELDGKMVKLVPASEVLAVVSGEEAS